MSLEVVSVCEALLTKVADVFGGNGNLRHGDRYRLYLLNDLTVLHHVADDYLLRLLCLLSDLLDLSDGLLLRLLNDRLLRLWLRLEKKLIKNWHSSTRETEDPNTMKTIKTYIDPIP